MDSRAGGDAYTGDKSTGFNTNARANNDADPILADISFSSI
jgi:hypothetical protein